MLRRRVVALSRAAIVVVGVGIGGGDAVLAQTPYLVKDTPGSAGSGLGEAIAVGSTLFFVADDAVHGSELWKTDGTAAGTVLVKDIWVGSSSSNPSYLTNVNGTLFFWATSTQPFYENLPITQVWKTDGTAAGTAPLGPFQTAVGEPSPMVSVNGTLFFAATFPYGSELWKSTPTGVQLVKDIRPGFSIGSFPSHLTNVNGTLFFGADDGTSGAELWKSDGTEVGTVLVKDIRPGSQGSDLCDLTNVNGTLFFFANDGLSGLELWKSNGTAAGTVLVKDISPAGTDDPGPASPVNVSGTLFFTTGDGTNGQELWKSNGTAAGTVLVKDIQPGSPGSNPLHLRNVNGTLFFRADDGVNGNELWRSNGTAAGTVVVKDIRPGNQGSDLSDVTDVNGTLFFGADDGSTGSELWRSDGTLAGTVLVSDIAPGSGSSLPSVTVGMNGTLYFRAFVEARGYELMKSNGTAAGTGLVMDINTEPAASAPFELVDVDGTLLFTGNDGAHGQEPWKSDGTAAGTALVRDIHPGAAGSNFRQSSPTPSPWLFGYSPPVSVNKTLYFMADDGTSGEELWKSDGTEGGTALVKDLNPEPRWLVSPFLTKVNDTLFFINYDQASGSELWKSDGTAAGTVLVEDTWPGGSSSAPTNMTSVNGTAYFLTRRSITGAELWRSDGTAAGTTLVKDLLPGLNSSYAFPLAAVGDTLFLQAETPATGAELWKSDGTRAGTVLVKDIRPGTASSSVTRYQPPPAYRAVIGGTYFFTAIGDQTTGLELWKSDGTDAGTALVKDIWPGFQPSRPTYLTNVNGTLFFAANDGPHGFELWKSDGTTAGTVLVKDIRPGTDPFIFQTQFAPPAPSQLTNVYGTLFFTADDGYSGAGTELWKSDGTAAGTVRVMDIRPGPASSDPRHLTVSGTHLFFSADDGVNGRELWALDVTPRTLTVSHTGNGSVTSSPPGINCGTACAADFIQGTPVTLTATPAPDNSFVSWSGACSGAGPCVVTMDAAKSVTATFIYGYSLTVTRTGDGRGRVSSSPGGIGCGTDCAEFYDPGTVVTLTATPARGSSFKSWTGACTGTGPCVVTLDAARSVTATFEIPKLGVDDVTVTEGDAGTTTADFAVTLSVAATNPVSVDWATQDGSATAGSDFVAASGTVAFSPGTTSQIVSVVVLGDTDPEPTETFFLNLTNPVNAPIADGQGRAVIQNDDLHPGSFYTLPPCRVLDTRGPTGSHGGPALVAAADRVFGLFGICGIPDSAKAVSINITVTEPTYAGHLWVRNPGGAAFVSTISYSAGQTRSNNAILGLSFLGELAVYCEQGAGTVHFILDVTGYFE